MKGTVPNVGSLPPTGNAVGDAYTNLADGNLYVWDGDSWNNVGPIQGPAGPPGADGATGPPGTTSWAGITDKPATFPPTLPIAQSGVTNLTTDLAAKLDASHAGTGGTAHANVVAGGAAGFISGADKTKLDGIATGATNYVHPTGDGNLHVPATSTTNNNKVLTAGATAGSLSWTTPATVTPAALTKADDANVTLTLGGTPTTALLQSTSITAGWTGTLSVARGGFGANVSASSGVPLFATGVATFTATTGTNNFVRSTAPTLDSYTDVTSIATPATPSTGLVRLFAGTSKGLDALGYVNSLGVPMVMARDRFFYARNTTGATLTKGTAVYLSGATGGAPLIAKAQANPTPVNVPCVGLVAADIANNANGAVMASGVMAMDTSAWTEGAKLYLSATTAGALTTTMPVHPNITQTIAMVEVSGIGNGLLLVNVLAINPHEYDGVNGTSWAIGDATGTTKSYLVKNAAGTGTLSWNPSANRTLTLPDVTATLATTTDLAGYATVSHTHTAANITDFSEAVDDRVGALLVAGTNITLSYNDAGNALTINASGGGGASVVISDTAPGSPTAGTLWFDSSSGNTFIWYDDASGSPSAQWIQISGAAGPAGPPGADGADGADDVTGGHITIASSAPGSPATGDVWIDTT